MAESFLENGPSTGTRADKTQVVVHTRVDSGGARDSSIEDGPHLPAETADRLACDTNVVEIEERADGTPLNLGRRTRRITSALRRVLEARDGVCQFPGCDSTKLEAHHRKHWLDGGVTSLGNLVSLCKFHHCFVHNNQWSIEMRSDGTFVVRDETGRAYPDPLPSPGSVHELVRHHEHAGLAIQPTTGTPEWDGTPVDYRYVVDVLTQGVNRAQPGTASCTCAWLHRSCRAVPDVSNTGCSAKEPSGCTHAGSIGKAQAASL